MIISVTGYGATGASAYVDLLREFDEVQSFPASVEFQILQEPDGLVDLQYNIVESRRRLNSNAAIKRFKDNINNVRNSKLQRLTKGRFKKISNDYIDKIIMISWKGRSNFDPIDLRGFFDNRYFRIPNYLLGKVLALINKNMSWPLYQPRYFSYMDSESFCILTKEYIKELLEAGGMNIQRPIVLEQVFNTSNPTVGMNYFDKIYSIIVDRDPRDVFMLTNHIYKNAGSFMPNTGDVKKFVTYYRTIHTPKSKNPNIRYVWYEDLIFQYEKVCQFITEWLGIKHCLKGSYFKPDCSINNTQIFQRFPEYREDIRYIEKELIDYLYPFNEMKGNINFIPANCGIFDKQK